MNYLYNGIELPALPEWDKEKYPYAFIYDYQSSAYSSWTLALYAEWEVVLPAFSDDYNVYTHGGAYFRIAPYENENIPQSWGEITEFEGSANQSVSRFIWSNTDAYAYDGTLLFAASDPVPVLPLDPTALLMGWLAGKRMAAMRGKQTDEPSGVYDDTFPIEWNTLAVLNNPTVAISGVLDFVKVSNLTPPQEEMANAVFVATFNGQQIENPYIESGGAYDTGYMALYSEMTIIVVTAAGQSADFGCEFPETGIYVMTDGSDDVSVDCAIKLPLMLYNGVQLYDINAVWDKETYPYAVMRYTDLGNGNWWAYVVFSSTTFVYSRILNDRLYLMPTKSGTIIGANCYSQEYINNAGLTDTVAGKWYLEETAATYDTDSDWSYGENNIWSNYDILNTDGTTYLAASEPIPVYE